MNDGAEGEREESNPWMPRDVINFVGSRDEFRALRRWRIEMEEVEREIEEVAERRGREEARRMMAREERARVAREERERARVAREERERAREARERAEGEGDE